ncbi:putative Endonuclease/exonuclease/phosphatase superfamily [Helianthus debilis subsp. tardiflorus]
MFDVANWAQLTYRIALSYRSAKALLEMQNWRALLEKDQLRVEQRRGRVFRGWNEGKIYFPPTCVTGYYDMVKVFISYHTCVAIQDFRIIGLCTAYFGLRSSRSKAVLEEA